METTVQNIWPTSGWLARKGFLLALPLLVMVCYFFLTDTAYAWGPGVHMVVGNWLLQNLAVLPQDVAAVLMQHPGQFLYGSLSPDFFIGKGSVAKKGHSHNWRSGLMLLRRARSGSEQAYAYGYLAHLAADTVAHNVYVPQNASGAPGTGRIAHVYLEMQADRSLDWDAADALSVFREKTSKESAALLRKTLRQTPWSFWLKRQLFRQSIALGGMKGWKSSLLFVDKMLIGDTRAQFVEQMLTISTRAVVSLLKDIRHSPIRRLDPIGADALQGLQGAVNLGKLATGLVFSGKGHKGVSGTSLLALCTKATHASQTMGGKMSYAVDWAINGALRGVEKGLRRKAEQGSLKERIADRVRLLSRLEKKVIADHKRNRQLLQRKRQDHLNILVKLQADGNVSVKLGECCPWPPAPHESALFMVTLPEELAMLPAVCLPSKP